MNTQITMKNRSLPPTDNRTYHQVKEWIKSNLPRSNWDGAEELAIEAALEFDLMEWDSEMQDNTKLPDWILSLAQIYFPRSFH